MKRLNKANIKALALKIKAFEYFAGESFTDYYMDPGVKPVSWGFWLLGKGFIERANNILELVDAKITVDQDYMFQIHSSKVEWSEEHNHWEDAYEKDILLWAEFLCSTDLYTKRITEFFHGEEWKNWSDTYDSNLKAVDV